VTQCNNVQRASITPSGSAATRRETATVVQGCRSVSRTASTPAEVSVHDNPSHREEPLQRRSRPAHSLDRRQIRTFTSRAPLHKNTVCLLALGHNQGAGQAANYANVPVDNRAPTRRYLESDFRCLRCSRRACFVCSFLRSGHITWTVSSPQAWYESPCCCRF
jgi:hypothetical protein